MKDGGDERRSCYIVQNTEGWFHAPKWRVGLFSIDPIPFSLHNYVSTL